MSRSLEVAWGQQLLAGELPTSPDRPSSMQRRRGHQGRCRQVLSVLSLVPDLRTSFSSCSPMWRGHENGLQFQARRVRASATSFKIDWVWGLDLEPDHFRLSVAVTATI